MDSRFASGGGSRVQAEYKVNTCDRQGCSGPQVHIVCGANVEFAVGCDRICTLRLPWSEGHHVEWHSRRSCSMSAYCCFFEGPPLCNDGDDDRLQRFSNNNWGVATGPVSPERRYVFFSITSLLITRPRNTVSVAKVYQQ